MYHRKRFDEHTVSTNFYGCKIADSRERVKVVQFRNLLYRDAFGHHGIDMHDRHCVHFLASSGGNIVAALRLVGPTPVPLEIEQFVNLRPSFGPGVRVMQVGGFWLAPDYRKVTKATVRAAVDLLDKAVQFATRLDVAVLVLRTTELLSKWYVSLGFQRAPSLDYDDPAYGAVFTMCRSLTRNADSPCAGSSEWRFNV